MQEHLYPARFLRSPLAVLVGAGVSMAAPSCLPSAQTLVNAILEDPRMPITVEQRDTLLASTTPDWPDSLCAYHFLRFEQVVESLGQTVDHSLSAVRALIPQSHPNEYHYTLATLLSQGHLIFTTNFDDLIETACAELGIEVRVIVTEGDYLGYLRNPSGFDYPLFKLHGSFSDQTENGVREAVATEAGILGAGIGFSPIKWAVVSKELNAHDLLVLGYSGFDDFDVMPAIAASGKDRRLYWSRYNPTLVRTFLQGSSRNFPSVGEEHFDSCFPYLMFGQHGRSVRQFHDVVVAQEDSLTTIRELLATPVRSSPKDDEKRLAVAPTPSAVPAWSREDRAPMLAARLLMHIGDYDPAIQLLHRFVQVSNDAIARGRCHLWLASMAADRHSLGEVTWHIERAFEDLANGPREELLFSDFVEILGFPFPTDFHTMEIALPRKWLIPTERQGGDDRAVSITAMEFGFSCANSIRRCVNRGDMSEARGVYRVFQGSELRPFQSDEVLADVEYWLALGCAMQVQTKLQETGTLDEQMDRYINEAAARANVASRVYERLQRRRKMIDSLLLVGTMEALEGRVDWARNTSMEMRAWSQLVGSNYGMAGSLSILIQVSPSDALTDQYDEWMARDAAADELGCHKTPHPGSAREP